MADWVTGFESRVAGLFGVLRKLLLYNRMMDLFWCMDKKKKKSSIRVRLATRDPRLETRGAASAAPLFPDSYVNTLFPTGNERKTVMRNEILKILRDKAPEPVSGEELAKQLGITRTAIWKHIQTLKKEGYGIEAYTKKGYALTSVPDKLLPSEIMAHLHTRFVGRAICYEESVTSSNEVLKKLADKNAADGTVCVAEEQTGGKGRLARGWFSPKGKGLWFSLLLKPSFLPQEAPKMTLLSAVAVVRAIREVCQVEARIKWPNDVVMSRRKICGILTEMGLNGAKIREVVIGVGINVNLKEIPSELQDKATSLYLETGKTYDRIQILAQVLECFEENYETFIRTCSLSGMVEEYNKLLANRNQPVRILDPNQPWEGTALGINEQGELLVKDEQGIIQTVRAGEVSVRGLYSYV